MILLQLARWIGLAFLAVTVMVLGGWNALGMSPKQYPNAAAHPSRAESTGGGGNCNRDSHQFRLLASGPFLGRLPNYFRRAPIHHAGAPSSLIRLAEA